MRVSKKTRRDERVGNEILSMLTSTLFALKRLVCLRFASTHHGNDLTEEEQWAKIELCQQVAEEVFGKRE